MARPTSKRALLDAIEREYGSLLEAVDAIPVDERSDPGACDEWSVKDILAHLDAWHRMFLGWHEIGSTGVKPPMPAEGFSWAETPELNAQIWQRTHGDEWDVVTASLSDSKAAVVRVIEGYTDESLFEKKRFVWTGSTSVGSYAVSATASHYAWATRLLRAFGRHR